MGEGAKDSHGRAQEWKSKFDSGELMYIQILNIPQFCDKNHRICSFLFC